MGRSKIEWTEYTWNPWHGCHKVSEGCRYCYMFRDKERYGQDPNKVILASKATFRKPLSIDNPSMIFTCSWSDFFIEEADEWRYDAWNIIKQTPYHTYQILTKRPERINANLPRTVLSNVWLGVSIENNKNAHRAEYLSNIGGYTTFISFEPLIERIDWVDNFNNVDWIIIGAESGNTTGKYRFRDCNIDWVASLAEEAKTNNIKVFIKQLRLNGNLIKDINHFPDELRLREYPLSKEQK